jgi:hypothetical protein
LSDSLRFVASKASKQVELPPTAFIAADLTNSPKRRTFMKHITTTRSLATAAITGALVIGTAGLAQADDDSRSSDRASESQSTTELGAPIEFGGLTVTNESGSSNSNDDTTVDGDESTSHSSTDERTSAQEVHLGAFSFDPSFLYEAANAQRGSERSTDDGDDVQRDSTSESASRTEGRAPASFGPSHGKTSSHDTSSDTTTHRDGDEATTETDTSENHSEQGLESDEFTIDPLFGNENGERESLVDSILK